MTYKIGTLSLDTGQSQSSRPMLLRCCTAIVVCHANAAVPGNKEAWISFCLTSFWQRTTLIYHNMTCSFQQTGNRQRQDRISPFPACLLLPIKRRDADASLAERSKAAVLRTVIERLHRFESCSWQRKKWEMECHFLPFWSLEHPFFFLSSRQHKPTFHSISTASTASMLHSRYHNRQMQCLSIRVFLSIFRPLRYMDS